MELHPDIYKGVAVGKPCDPFLQTWSRRFLVYGTYMLLLALMTLGAPVILPVAFVMDLIKRQNWSTLRITLVFWVYFAFEVGALFVEFTQWLLSGIWLGLNKRRFLLWNFALQRWWVGHLIPTMLWIFNARIIAEGDYDLARKPFLLFMRHSSTADTPLGPYFAFAQGVSLRIVVKRGLLLDPAIETSFNRCPNVFVRRDGVDSAKQIEAVGALMDDFGPAEGILIYPEGTRYTEAKKARIIEKLTAAGDEAAVARARALKRSLPPRPGGPLKLLEKNTGADVIFCAHVGLEASTSFREMWNGRLIGGTVRFKFWRVPFAEIPTKAEAQEAWLYQHWLKVDEFVVDHLGEDQINHP